MGKRLLSQTDAFQTILTMVLHPESDPLDTLHFDGNMLGMRVCTTTLTLIYPTIDKFDGQLGSQRAL